MEDTERQGMFYMLAIAQHEVDELNVNIAEHILRARQQRRSRRRR
jgi:hypothetical protein